MSDIVVQPQQTTVEVIPDGNTVVITGSPNTRDVIIQGAIPGPAGPGVPAGGTTGELLIKQSSTNYDTAWEPVSGDASLAADGTLTLQPAAISGKTSATLTGAEEVLINDAGTLKKTTTQDIADLGGGGGGGLADPGANGIVVRTALNTTVARTLTAGTNVSVSNGSGVSGNPTVSVPDASTTTKGVVELATDGEVAAGLAVQANDSRLHAAVTVTDSDTVDLTLTGQDIEADVRTQLSITSDANGIKLSGDAATPGNNRYYGTNGSGTKGYHALPADTGITQLTGDVTAGPGSGSQAATIPNDTVTYAKMQNVSAASRLIGRGSASGAGDPEEITLGTGLTMTGTVLSSSGGGASVTISTTPPVGPAAGDLWFNSENGTLYVYYDDGDTQQWVAPDNGGGEMTTLDFVARWCAPMLWQIDWPADAPNAANGYYSVTLTGTGATNNNTRGMTVQTGVTAGSRARATFADTGLWIGQGTSFRNIDWSKNFVFHVAFTVESSTANGQNWIKISNSANSDGDITNEGVQIRIDNLTLYAGAHDGTTLNESSGTAISGSTQYGLTIIGDGSNYAFYLDNAPIDTLAGPTAFIGFDARYAVESYNGADSANQRIDTSPIKVAAFA